MDEILISGNSGVSLCFSSLNGDHVEVTISSSSYRVSRQLYIFCPHGEDLNCFFKRLAKNTQPWKGCEAWKTLEGEFGIEATCDSSGHVTFVVNILHHQESWHMNAAFGYDLGMLADLSKSFRKFWN